LLPFIARTIAIERLEKILFVELDEVSDDRLDESTSYTHKIPMETLSSFTPSTISTRIGLSVPSFLYYTAEWLLEKGFRNPNHGSTCSVSVFTRSPESERVDAIYTMMERTGISEAIRSVQEGCVVEVANMLMEFLRKRPLLLPVKYHQVLRGAYHG
jgi:hypothetical protein